MKKKPIPEVVQSVIGNESYDDGWEVYMEGVSKAWRWERPFTDEEKTKIEAALIDAGYNLKKVKMTRIPAPPTEGRGSPMLYTDLGNNCTYVWKKA